MSDNTTLVWSVPPDHPTFAGHFPGNPIVPGVLLLDQAILMVQTLLGRGAEVWTVAQAKFLSPVGPGEEVAFDFSQDARGGWRFAARVGARSVASGHLMPQPA